MDTPWISREITREAHPQLTGDLAFINNEVISLVLDTALQKHIRLERMHLSFKLNREKGWVELVLKVFVPLDLQQSLVRDAIGDAVQSWAQTLSEKQRRVLNEQYALFVEPLIHEGGKEEDEDK